MLRIILELNPPWPANVIAAVPEDPVWNVIEEIGLIAKSGALVTVTAIWAECVAYPPPAVIVTV